MEMKVLRYILILSLWFSGDLSYAQKYKSVSGEAGFFSSAPLEDIKAQNKTATGLFDSETGSVAFVVPIKGFRFRKSLMQEHFNENFMESDKYPQGTFEGKISGYDLNTSGEQDAVAEGKMTIHGVTQNVRIPGKFRNENNRITMEAVFPVKLEDYDISIPRVLFMNIAEEVEVTVRFIFEKTG